MSDEPRKRSRFDQTEPEPRRPSRFDRRSRSPTSRNVESRRSRSPLGSGNDGLNNDPAARAAAAAARINQSLERKKGIQHVDVPPIRSGRAPDAGNDATGGEIYTQDGDFIKDIEVNDLRNRYTLTKGSTQKMIKDETGADVTTRGSYYPDKSMATAANPPLYLHVTSTTKEGLEQAVKKIEDLMQQELPNLVDERRFKRREPEQFERDELGRRKWPEECIPIDLEPIPGFNLRARVVGPGGSYVKHVQGETRCRVQIKGRGSGFVDHITGRESDEPMYLHVAGPDPEQVQTAKTMCIDLLSSVRAQYDQFKERGPQHRYGGGDGGRHGGDNRGHGNQHGGYGANQSHQNTSATSPTGADGSGQAPDYAAQYAHYYAANGQDPYAAYGGYQGYLQAYYQYYSQVGTQQAADANQQGPPPPPGTDASGAAAPPPPPPPSNDEDAPPPPPPGVPASSTNTYSAVPPPPGL